MTFEEYIKKNGGGVNNWTTALMLYEIVEYCRDTGTPLSKYISIANIDKDLLKYERGVKTRVVYLSDFLPDVAFSAEDLFDENGNPVKTLKKKRFKLFRKN